MIAISASVRNPSGRRSRPHNRVDSEYDMSVTRCLQHVDGMSRMEDRGHECRWIRKYNFRVVIYLSFET